VTAEQYDIKSGGPNAWKPHYRQGGFVHSFQSYRRSPVFDATAHEISAKGPLEPLGSSSLLIAADEVIE